jgi:hypothetical protein
LTPALQMLDTGGMKRHLPRGRWTRELLDAMPWRELAEISRYRYRGTKKWAKRRIHKMERQQAKQEEGPDRG